MVSLFTAVETAGGGREACLSAVKAALRTGADVHERGGVQGSTALAYAVGTCADAATLTALVETLVAAGADVRAKDDRGYEPLHVAALNGSAEAAAAAVRALVAAGAEVRAENK